MFLSKIAKHFYTLKKSGGYTAFDQLIYKKHFRFKKCLNIASSTDKHITYLNYHSVGYLTMYYFVFGRL